MAGNGKSGRKPYKNTAIHKANMKIKGLEKNVEQLATMIGKSDTNIYKLENEMKKNDLDIQTVDVCRQDAESDLLRKNHKSDTNIYKLEELVSDLGSMVGQNFDQIDRYGNMQRKLSEDIENLFEMVGSSKKQPRRRRRSYFSLIRSLLYSRKTRRGVRAVAIYGTVIFAGAYALSLLLQ